MYFNPIFHIFFRIRREISILEGEISNYPHMPKYLAWLSFLCFFLLGKGLPAQDIHFSHLHRAPLHLNPALAGLAPGDIRFGGLYRHQWHAVPVPYTTLLAFADARLSRPSFGPGVFGAGLQLLTDEAGDGAMRWFQGAVSVSYMLPLGNRLGLSVGFQGSFSQRSFEYKLLTFDEQFNGDQFNAGAPTGEDSGANSLAFFSLASGANLRFKMPESRTQFDLGIGVHHLLRPASTFLGDKDIRLSRRYSPYLLGMIQVLPRLDILVRAWWQNQQPYSEWIAGAGLAYHLQTGRNREISLECCMLHRWKDALVPQVGLRYRSWEAGFSYDINLSDFQQATNQRGGPEFYLQYFITRVQAPPVFKACPIY